MNECIVLLLAAVNFAEVLNAFNLKWRLVYSTLIIHRVKFNLTFKSRVISDSGFRFQTAGVLWKKYGIISTSTRYTRKHDCAYVIWSLALNFTYVKIIFTLNSLNRACEGTDGCICYVATNQNLEETSMRKLLKDSLLLKVPSISWFQTGK